MKFPERVLRVKAESQKDHERWYEAVKDARQKKLDGNNTPQAKQLESLKVMHDYCRPLAACWLSILLLCSNTFFDLTLGLIDPFQVRPLT